MRRTISDGRERWGENKMELIKQKIGRILEHLAQVDALREDCERRFLAASDLDIAIYCTGAGPEDFFGVKMDLNADLCRALGG